jgi:uncharacterized integral membrane protein (TIGR00697 family)
MTNEIIFIFHSGVIALSALVALSLGPLALSAFVCIQCLLANIFVIKQINLFGFNATCSDVFTIGATFGLNLLQEYYGKETAKRTIWINFFLLIFYTIVSQIHLYYTPSLYDTTQTHFQPLLMLMPRIVIASFLVYLTSQMCDYAVYGFLKRLLVDRYLLTRNYLSIAFCQLVDTVLFSLLGLYGIVHNIGEVIVVSYAIKLLSLILMVPFMVFSLRIIKKEKS